MTIIVTEHAIDRFAERVTGIQPHALTHHERGLIRGVIRKAVGRNSLARRYVRTTLATYVIGDDGVTVVTVLPRHKETASSKLGEFLGDRP